MKKKTKKIIGISLASLLLFLIIVIWVGVVLVYNQNFCQRFSSFEAQLLYVSDYPGLSRSQYKFESNKGQLLTGYLYENEGTKKGIVIVAHGFGGGGHNSYMDCISVFAKNGYYVFAYDASGNDESQGLGKSDGVGGLPQGIIDLSYAISFVENSGNFPALPLVLFGHSWGGYSVCSVAAYHPQVAAIAECSGFVSSAGMFETEGKKFVGNAINIMMPFLCLHEFFKYGKWAFANGVRGLSKTEAPVMIIHSQDDDTVPVEYGYNLYYEKFKDDPRFNFILYDNRGHSNILRSPEGIEYLQQFNQGAREYYESLDYDYKASENYERYLIDRAAYLNKYLDRKLWANSPNEELLLRIVRFYDEAIGE